MNFSKITDFLFVGETPAASDYDCLRELGVRLVINMRFEKGPAEDPHCPPLEFLWLRTFDNPLLPIPIRSLMRGVHTALETIQSGGKVYAHCQRGRHRGAAMGASILVALGYSPEEAMTLIKENRPISDPTVFYIRSRIIRFARRWASLD